VKLSAGKAATCVEQHFCTAAYIHAKTLRTGLPAARGDYCNQLQAQAAAAPAAELV
jgi:hypothetical protein